MEKPYSQQLTSVGCVTAEINPTSTTTIQEAQEFLHTLVSQARFDSTGTYHPQPNLFSKVTVESLGETYEAFAYRLNPDQCAQDELEAGVVGNVQWSLPCAEFEGLWEELYFDPGVKEELMTYSQTALLFAKSGVSPIIIPFNRLILLYGPTGTGKTTLCKALAQKLAVRNAVNYNCVLFEVNAHSLFSKYFSESGKLVLKMFDRIRDIAEDETTKVFVLLDEVESLAMSREAMLSPSDPADALRVVNAVLTQIDQLSRFPNVLLLCTSNIEKALDTAFLDRADLKLHIGQPNAEARFRILASCVRELERTGLMQVDAENWEELIYNTCNGLEGQSGRSLRKLSFSAYAPELSRFIAKLQHLASWFRDNH